MVVVEVNYGFEKDLMVHTHILTHHYTEKKSSFLGSTNPTFQSFGKEKHPTTSTGDKDDDVLEWTQEELDIFKTQQKDESAAAPEPRDGSDIVVRYSDKESPMETKFQEPASHPVTSEYATVNEIAIDEERKKKKRGRKISKSIQKALKPGQRVKDSTSTKSSQKGFSGPEMGFKPQFRTNPLQKMPVIETHPPPTPPPTPATGGSISTSDVGVCISCMCMSTSGLHHIMLIHILARIFFLNISNHQP